MSNDTEYEDVVPPILTYVKFRVHGDTLEGQLVSKSEREKNPKIAKTPGELEKVYTVKKPDGSFVAATNPVELTAFLEKLELGSHFRAVYTHDTPSTRGNPRKGFDFKVKKTAAL